MVTYCAFRLRHSYQSTADNRPRTTVNQTVSGSRLPASFRIRGKVEQSRKNNRQSNARPAVWHSRPASAYGARSETITGRRRDAVSHESATCSIMCPSGDGHCELTTVS